MDRELLKKGALIFGVGLSEGQLDSFAALFDELMRWNKQINLTALKKSADITIKHFIDSLSVAPLMGRGARLLDIGSGGGFPVLPLAIARPDLHITSIDAVNKKILFQRHIIRLLKISSVEALHVRAEDLALKHGSFYDFVTSRAVSNLMAFIELATPFLSEEGKAISMRGADGEQEVRDAADEILATGFKVEQVLRYDLPHKMGRRILVVASKVP